MYVCTYVGVYIPMSLCVCVCVCLFVCAFVSMEVDAFVCIHVHSLRKYVFSPTLNPLSARFAVRTQQSAKHGESMIKVKRASYFQASL